MSKLTDQQYNQLCAKLMGFEVQPNNAGGLCAKFENNICNGNWNPATDANDTNKVIEKMLISIIPVFDEIAPPAWITQINYDGVMPIVSKLNKDRDIAIRQCIETVLIEWSKQK